MLQCVRARGIALIPFVFSSEMRGYQSEIVSDEN